MCLIEVFSEEEVKEVVWQCETSKSPDPDGWLTTNHVFNFFENVYNELIELKVVYKC